jgi:hypothetical protein
MRQAKLPTMKTAGNTGPLATRTTMKRRKRRARTIGRRGPARSRINGKNNYDSPEESDAEKRKHKPSRAPLNARTNTKLLPSSLAARTTLRAPLPAAAQKPALLVPLLLLKLPTPVIQRLALALPHPAVVRAGSSEARPNWPRIAK